MKIAVVVLHYRNFSDTLECLDSLSRQDYPAYEILLVDNASEDPELENAVKPFSRLHFVRNTENLGFAEGNNVGIRAALERGADAVLLLNNDAVAAPDALSSFARAAAAHPDAAVFGAKIFFYDEPTQIWHAGGNVNPRTYRCFHNGCLDSDLEKQWDAVRDIGYACGCALFVKREAIEKVGLMAPEFFLIWEEIDWCWRIRKAGYRCLFVPEAKVWHKISRAFEGGNRGPLWQYYYFRNRLLFLQRNIPKHQLLRFYVTRFPKELCEILFFSINPRSLPEEKRLNRAALKGIADFFLRRFFKGAPV
ncbi:MAG: glycosyltransferase family 2 protein [Verrucomicrobia bacterium]|nr:glycosyltransferase family 2 protein [Verrucomicrobiota bacterium]